MPITLLQAVPDMPEPPTSQDPRSEDFQELELMARVRSGDVAAFEQVVERLWGRTFLYARYLVGDRDRACDVAQEAFTRLWQKREDWKPSGSVAAWLLCTARNAVVSEQRKGKIRKHWASISDRDDKRRPPTPLQEMEREELRSAMERAIQQLSPRRKEVFTLFHLQGLSHREVAEVMNIRPQTAANYLQAALADLRSSLAPFFPTLSGADHPPPSEEPEDPAE